MPYYAKYILIFTAIFLAAGLLLAYLAMIKWKDKPKESLFWKSVDYFWFTTSTITFVITISAGYRLFLAQDIAGKKDFQVAIADGIRSEVVNVYNKVCIEPLLLHLASNAHSNAPLGGMVDCEVILPLYSDVLNQALAEANEDGYQTYQINRFVDMPLRKNSHLHDLQGKLKNKLVIYKSNLKEISKLNDEAGFLKSPKWSTAFIISFWITAIALAFRLMKVHAEVAIEKRNLSQKKDAQDVGQKEVQEHTESDVTKQKQTFEEQESSTFEPSKLKKELDV